MPDFKRRCLYRIKTENGPGAPDMLESLWAYSFTYTGASNSTPGRYRIRITKFMGEEAYRLFGVEDPSTIAAADEIFSMQAYLEKWTGDKWAQCLDWMGSPEDSVEKIERDLNEMYQSFITGLPIGDTIITPPPFMPRKPPKTSRKPKPPRDTISDAPKGDDSSDFDWI